MDPLSRPLGSAEDSPHALPERFGPGIYVHFPFCRTRCGYCDFFVVVGSPGARDEFLEDLDREIDLASASEDFTGARFQSLFLGGGTPSLLPGRKMGALIRRIRDRFDLAPDAEITVECNPETLSRRRIEAYRAAGVNRVSLGVQSLEASSLRMLDRAHTRDEVALRVQELRLAGFDNVSCDLIYGVPSEEFSGWMRTVEAAIRLEPDHISAYLLTLEPRVPLARRLSRHGPALPSDESALEQNEWLKESLAQAGYFQYEISNFARPGKESRHNQNYWVRGDYLGLGPSAHSHRRGRRWSNAASMRGYQRALRNGHLPRSEAEVLDPAEIAAEWIFLGLRRNVGVQWSLLDAALPKESREAVCAQIDRLEEQGMLAWRGDRGEHLCLTSRAQFVSDRVFAELMASL